MKKSASGNSEIEQKQQLFILKSLSESIKSPIFSVDKAFNYTSFNKTHAGVMKLLYNSEIELHHNMLDYMAVMEDRDKAKLNILRALKGEHFVEESFSGEEQHTRLYFEVTHDPIFDEHNKVIGAVVMARDITAHKLSEEALQQNEASLEDAQALAHMGNWELDPVTGIGFWSKELYHLHECDATKGVPVFSEFIQMVHPDDRELMLSLRKWVIENGKSATMEYRLNPDRGNRYLETTLYAFKNDQGKLFRLSGTVFDITERKQAEVKLRESENKFRKIYEDGPLGMAVVNIGFHFTMANNTFCRMIGYEEQELQSLSFKDITHPDHVAGDVENIKKLIKGEIDIYKTEKRYLCKKNQIIWGAVTVTAIHDNNGKFLYFLAMIEDITERKHSEEQLLIAKEKAEESDRLKTAFLHNMSHEIRTPMNSIMGFSDLLPNNFNNKPKLEYLTNIIKQRSSDLLNIIGEILDIAKIESGQLTVHLENCQLQNLFKEIHQLSIEHRNHLNKQHIDFKVSTHFDLAESNIIIDQGKLKQIFVNLIGNAFKYTEKGKIEAGCLHSSTSLRVQGTLNDGQQPLSGSEGLIFYVTDTGIGIPKEKQLAIFERFIQVESGLSRQYGGTGLGLSIAKGLLEILGGDIWLDSEPGKGSTFYFSLPYTIAKIDDLTATEQGNIELMNVTNRTILIVEDEKYNALYLKEILSNTGINILEATLGNEAVTIALEQSVDIILMDIRLPDINGYEASRQIKMHKPHLKIIAQTAYAAPSDKEKAMEAGCDDYISKPIKRELLLSKIAYQLNLIDPMC